MGRRLRVALVCAAWIGCSEGGSEPEAYRVGAAVDLDGDGRADGTAVDDDGDGRADGVDTNGDGRSDRPLPGGPPLTSTDSSVQVPDAGSQPPPVGPADAATTTPDVVVVPDGSCAAIEQEAELVRPPADIVIALDTSFSMAPQICNTSANLSKFADNVGPTTRVATVYEMGPLLAVATAGLCGVADPLATTQLSMDPTRYLQVKREVDSSNALSMLLDTFATYSPFLRPGSPTHFVVVSDDESRPLTAPDFKAQMEQRLGHPFYFHAIVADGQNLCFGTRVGMQYLTLADMTMGQKLSMCEQDWSVLFKKLEEAVAASAPLPCDFDVPAPPTGQTFDKGAVSVVYTPQGGQAAHFPRADDPSKCGDKQGWHYDNAAQPKRIQFCPAACTQVRTGGKISIAFGCAPPVVLE